MVEEQKVSEEEVKKEKYILAYSIGYLIHQDKESVKLWARYDCYLAYFFV